jgi:hypothetical protein
LIGHVILRRDASLRGVRDERGEPRLMPLRIGDEAPDFTLRSSDGRDVTLSSFRAVANVVLIAALPA